MKRTVKEICEIMEEGGTRLEELEREMIEEIENCKYEKEPITTQLRPDDQSFMEYLSEVAEKLTDEEKAMFGKF